MRLPIEGLGLGPAPNPSLSGDAMFKIRYRPSTSHWLFPPIIFGILAVLLALIILQRFLRCRKTGEPFLDIKGKRFFVANWDRLRLLGTVVLMVLYIYAMEWLGFLTASIIVVFLFNILYNGVDRLKELPAAMKSGKLLSSSVFKSLLLSLTISVSFSFVIWYLFGSVFKITLP